MLLISGIADFAFKCLFCTLLVVLINLNISYGECLVTLRREFEARGTGKTETV